MATITHLHERLRPVPNRIDAEVEVLAAASDLLPAVARLPLAEALGRSGLLAVSVPSDFGGLDVSNVVLAEAVSVIAAASAKAAEALTSHCAALEAIRNAGSEEQRRSAFARSAAGECFLLLAGGGGVAKPDSDVRFLPDGMGFRVEGEVRVTTVADADWLAIPAADPSGQSALLLVPRTSPGLEFSEAGDEVSSLLRFAGVHMAADGVLALTHHAGPLVEGVHRLLRAAVVHGQGRRELETVLDAVDPGKDATIASAHAIGWRQVEIETVHALIVRAAAAIDVAQVNPALDTIAQAQRLAAILGVTAQRMDTGRTAGEEEDAVIAALGRQMIAGRDEKTV